MVGSIVFKLCGIVSRNEQGDLVDCQFISQFPTIILSILQDASLTLAPTIWKRLIVERLAKMEIVTRQGSPNPQMCAATGANLTLDTII